MGIYQFQPEDAERFARDQHLTTWHKGNELRFKYCPYCRERTNDKDTFSINLETGQFKCLRASCGAKGNMITLAHDFGFSLGQDTDEYYQSKRKYRNLRKYPKPTSKAPAIEYMERRGISAEVTKTYGITTQDGHDNILVFPFLDENKVMQFVKYRKADFDKTKDKNKEWCEVNCKPILFGMDQCDPTNGTLVLTEGQIDSLSVAESGIKNAVSVPTGAKGFTWIPYCWDFLSKYDSLIVFGDYEHGKITLLEEMSKRFHGSVLHVRPEDYRDCKDANDLLRKYGKEAVWKAVKNAVPVEDPFIESLAKVKRENLADREKLSTGLVQADRVLSGLYFGTLTVLTGERGFGKSTFASQLMTRALQQGYKVFAYSGELVDFMFQEWVERQMAGPDHINAKKHESGFCDYRVDYKCVNAITQWYADRFYIYDLSATRGQHEDLSQTIEKAYQQYGCRVIFIDNLMTAMSDNMAVDLYRQQTAFVQELASMARKYNILIILVAHPRKSGGSVNVFQNDDVAGSGNITNLASVILNYTKPSVDDRNPDPNPGDRVLQITKNRETGRTQMKGIKLWFDEASKRISEAYGRFDWELGWETEPDFEEAPEDFELPFGDDQNET